MLSREIFGQIYMNMIRRYTAINSRKAQYLSNVLPRNALIYDKDNKMSQHF